MPWWRAIIRLPKPPIEPRPGRGTPLTVRRGNHGPELAHEGAGALALPDVHLGMDLQQKVSALAHELPPELLGHVPKLDRARVQVALEVEELADEISIELGLEVAEGRLRDLPV